MSSKMKVIGYILSSVLILGMITSCGTSSQNETTNDSANSNMTTEIDAQNDDVKLYLETGKITDEPVTLRWLHKYPEEKYASYFQTVADEYMREHSNVKIEIEAVGDEPIKEKLRVMAGSGNIPDIFFSWGGEFAGKFVRAELIEDLTPYVEADKTWSDSFSNTFWNVGQMYGIRAGVPLRFNAGAIVYNVKMMENLGIEELETWDDFISACEKIKESGKTPIVYGNKYPWHSAWWFTTIFRQTVPEEIRVNDYTPTTGEWTDPGYKQGIQMMQELQNKGYLNTNVNSTTWDQCLALFNNGDAGFFLSSVMNFPDHDKIGDDNWDWMPFPSTEGTPGTNNTMVGSADLFLVSRESEHPEVAVDFLKTLTSIENQAKLAETGLAPVVKGAMPNDTYPKILEAIDYINNDCEGLTEYFDTANATKMADIWLENFQLLFENKDADIIMKEVQDTSKQLKEDLAE